MMDIRNIGSLGELKKVTQENDRAFLLLYKEGTGKSDCALHALDELDGSISEELVFMKADVSSVRDIHPEYGIESIPTLLEFRSGKLRNLMKGCNSREFYISAIKGSQAIHHPGGEKRQKNVIVYSTPSCTWCNTLKTYLIERKIHFRDIDVSADQKAAEQMVNKSGQQGVPQTDIDGQIIVGFDKKRIDSLLEFEN